MTATLGLERLPRRIATLLEEGAANLAAIANELDVHGDLSALDAIARREGNGDRIVHDLIEDRVCLIAIATMSSAVRPGARVQPTSCLRNICNGSGRVAPRLFVR